MIKTNKIRCRECKTILESKTIHDLKQCKCKNKTFVDGGHDYQRIGAVNMNKVDIWDDKEKIFKKVKQKI